MSDNENNNYWSDDNESENELIQESRELPPIDIQKMKKNIMKHLN